MFQFFQRRFLLDPRHQHTQAIGADKAHPCRARNRPALIGKRAGAVAKPCGENDAERCALLRGCRDRGRHGSRRHSDDGDIGRMLAGVGQGLIMVPLPDWAAK